MSVISKIIALKNYSVHFVESIDGLFEKLKAFFQTNNQHFSKFIFISDKQVQGLYSDQLRDKFESENMKTLAYAFEPGENSKSRQAKDAIEDWMAENQCNRDVCILAVGGGVVGDLAGFVASTYMRGVKYVHIPTTLLAIVDSSIGGKTGINIPAGKNLIGSIYDPMAVMICYQFIGSMTQRVWCNGLAEIVKIAAALDENFFELIEKNKNKIVNHSQLIKDDPMLLSEIIYRAIKLKVDIVEADSADLNLRKVLNFGHTIGHAIEAVYVPTLLHGECVAIGMAYEVAIAVEMGRISLKDSRRLCSLLKSLNLPVRLSESEKINSVLAKMKIDKKNHFLESENSVCVVILEAIGRTHPQIVQEIPLSLAKKVLIPLISFHPVTERDKSCTRKIKIPGSKSITNRALLISALGVGLCRLENVLMSSDTEAMIGCLLALGVDIEHVSETCLAVKGTGGRFLKNKAVLDVNNSGTASRFLLAVCAMLEGVTVVIKGGAQISNRPIAPLVTSLRKIKCGVEYLVGKDKLPVEVKSEGMDGRLIEIDSSLSSQYVSALLMAAPFCNNESVVIKLTGNEQNVNVTSAQFIEMTIQLMAIFGVKVKQMNKTTFFVAKSGYTNPKSYFIETDSSSATYALAFSAISPNIPVKISNFPKSTLQGDSRFPQILQKMGCELKFKKDYLKCQAPKSGPLKALGVIDMSEMTDSFMTLAVLAAVAEGVTEIFNIENQRFKECNRIKAVIDNLKTIGVKSVETKTGLVIVGNPNVKSLKGALIKCHDDHRIAMSFSVLCAKVKNIILDNKFCVEKTFPNFFQNLEKEMLLKYNEKVAEKCEELLEIQAGKEAKKDANTVVIIGMRGVGKSTLGKFAANFLKLDLFDIDHIIEAEFGCRLKNFIDKNGMEKFRKIETAAFMNVFNKSKSGRLRLIVCGGGIVENVAFGDFVRQRCELVVHVRRNFNAVVKTLTDLASVNLHRADLGDRISEVWDRRKGLFDPIANYDFYVTENMEKDKNNFCNFCQRLLSNAINPGLSERFGGERESFFVCLSLESYSDNQKKISEMVEGANAIEMRIDLLSEFSEEYISAEIYSLMSFTNLPLIFTLVCDQNGNFPFNANLYKSFVRLGLKSGCEFVSVEWNRNLNFSEIIKQHKPKNTSVIACYHYSQQSKDITLEAAAKKLSEMSDIIKIVADSSSTEESIDCLYRFNKLRKALSDKLCIFVDKGEFGILSRLANKPLSPITHPLLKTPAAVGQLDLKNLARLRHPHGPKKAFLIGKDIKKSFSPLIHNEIYLRVEIDMTYNLFDTRDESEIKKLLREKDFFCANVTTPYKETVIKMLHGLSKDCEKIGAVNTIVRDVKSGKLIGHNTDWKAIYHLVSQIPYYRTLKHLNRLKALVLGAGGAARAAVFAAARLGIPPENIFVCNRSPERAVELARHFGCQFLSQMSEILISESLGESLLLIVCVPNGSKIELPAELQSFKRVWVVEMNYGVAGEKTEIERQIENPQWIVSGMEVLVQQAKFAVEIWAERVVDLEIECVGEIKR